MGTCVMCRRMNEIDALWEAIGIKDVTAHELWSEYEHLMMVLAEMSLSDAWERIYDQMCA